MNPQSPPLSSQTEVPKDKPQRPQDWKPPVKWLGGQQLIQSLKWIFIYAVLKRPLDPRRWMNAEVISGETEEFMRAQDGEFWFDYISDSGDGQKAMYNVACLCLSDLYAVGGVASVGSTVRLPAPGTVAAGEKSSGDFKLPRGSFLFVGGDTAYHVADKQTLFEQFQSPFWWAFNDMRDDGLITEDDPRRPIFAVPGNHDYYDSIHGFNRQFRRFHRQKPGNIDTETGTDLQLKGFKRIQTASYIALRLPFDWWFWALDDENGDLDERQKQFFIEACPADAPVNQDAFTDGRPNKLIVATPEQTTVYGQWVNKSDKTADSFRSLGLEQPFLNPAPTKKEIINEPEYQDINEGKCRLDLSGNVHLYARYWGKSAPGVNDSAKVENAEYYDAAPEKDNYASIVSGLGGAFHHPSLFSFNEIDERVLFPAKDVARREVAGRIFPWHVWKSGDVWILGAVITLILFLGVTFSPSTRDSFNNFYYWHKLNLTQSMSVDSATTPSAPTAPATTQTSPQPPKYFSRTNKKELPPLYWLGPIFVFLSVAAIIVCTFYTSGWVKPSAKQPNKIPNKVEQERASDKLKRQQGISIFLLVMGVVLFILGYIGLIPGYYSNGAPSYRYETQFGCSIWILAGLIWSSFAIITSILISGWHAKQKKRDWKITWISGGLAIFAVLGFGIVLRYFGRYGSAYLLSDLIVMLIILGGAAGIIYFAIGTGGELYSEGRRVKLWGLPVKGKILFGILGFVHYFSQLFIPFLLALRGNIVSLFVSLLIIAAFTYLSNRLFKRRLHKTLLLTWVFTIALLFLTPLFLQQISPRKCPGIEKGNVLIAPCTELARLDPPSLPCSQCHELARWVQSPAWLWQPVVELVPQWMTGYRSGAGWSFYRFLLVLIIVGLIGALLSCTLLSWYFIVSLGFKGHYNDAAGAVRIDRFQQIIRFRLREKENDLTGFVITLDYKQKDDGGQKSAGRKVEIPKATIIDVFQIKPRPKASGSAS